MDIPVGIKSAAFKAGLDEMKSQAAEFAGSVSGLFAGIGIASMFEGALEKAKSVEELSRRFGDTAENVQKLGYAAKLMGSDMEEVSRGGFKAFIEAQKAVSGNHEARQHFEDLGISIEKLSKLTGPRDALIALADAVGIATDQHKALADASEIVGGRQAALIQLFRAGGQALRDMGDQAEIMSHTTVSSLANAQRALDKWKEGATDIVGTVLAKFLELGRAIKGLPGLIEVATQGNSSAERSANAVLGWKAYKDFIHQKGVDDKPSPPTGDPDTDPKVIREKEEQADRDERAREKKERDAEEGAQRMKRLSDEVAGLEEKHRMEAMDGEQKLKSLKFQRDAAHFHANDDPKQNGEQKLEFRKKELEFEEQIGRVEKENSEAKTRALKEQQEKRGEYARQLEEAQGREKQRSEENALNAMKPAKRREFLKKQQDMLYYEADQAERKGEPLAASRARNKATEIQDQINSIRDEVTGGHSSGITFKVSSLVSVGGGKAGGLASDPSLRHLERQTNSLEDIRENVRALVGRGGNSSHERPVHPK